jgi:hypothetical protein
VIFKPHYQILLYVSFEKQFYPFFVRHLLKLCLFIPTDTRNERNSFDDDGISIFVMLCSLNRLVKFELKPMAKRKESDQNYDQSEQLKGDDVVFVESDHYLHGKGKLLMEDIIFIDQMAVFCKFHSGILRPRKEVGLHKEDEVENDQSDHQAKEDDLSLREKSSDLAAQPIGLFLLFHLRNLLSGGREMYARTVHIFCSDTVLRLAAGAACSIGGLRDFLEAEICIVPMHLADDGHVGGIAIQQGQRLLVLVVLPEFRGGVAHRTPVDARSVQRYVFTHRINVYNYHAS